MLTMDVKDGKALRSISQVACPLSLAVLQGVAQRHPLPTSGGL